MEVLLLPIASGLDGDVKDVKGCCSQFLRGSLSCEFAVSASKAVRLTKVPPRSQSDINMTLHILANSVNLAVSMAEGWISWDKSDIYLITAHLSLRKYDEFR